MDFGQPHVQRECVATKSNICVLPTKQNREQDDFVANKRAKLDNLVIKAANQVAMDIFCGPSMASKIEHSDGDDKTDQTNKLQEHEQHPNISNANCKLYPERSLPSQQIITPNSLVVIFESFTNLNFVYVQPDEIFSNRNGHFHHNDFIGKPFGSKVRSRANGGLGYLYLLKPTPELWTCSLPHRTQIVHELDSSLIIQSLDIRPNMTVCESGTGSGAMSHMLARSIAPHGKLHTFEFNGDRVKKAKEEFMKHGLDHLVTVHWRDVCGEKEEKCPDVNDNQEKRGMGGFDLPPSSVHAIFLDLPNPWLAIPHASKMLVDGGRIGSYSPCVEQTQRAVRALSEHGFHSIRTMEVRLREYYVDEVNLEDPPSEKRVDPQVNGDGGGKYIPPSLAKLQKNVQNSGSDNNNSTLDEKDVKEQINVKEDTEKKE
uniref:tRNA (adenine(58)-N(1))-methyltransferase n=1 Tax=Ditylum brightwellii TaxID=49249 RepID=A0A7S1ZKV0_9STRA|mmetsp:Transcript_33634/g.50160  ORF Transcript_33634/g.50160 Transcript_33634/m.50160 type:complete len:429 (+) Transcript_33634:129-1415(+)